MKIELKVIEDLGDDWFPDVYASEVRTQRTRAYTLDIREAENTSNIEYTLLGIQLKVGNQRIACPDLATARYLRVFARIGCRDFAIPYDITRISAAADALESAWQKALVVLEYATTDRSKRSRSLTRSRLVRSIRQQLTNIGPGDQMPKFDKPTRRRST